MNQDDLQSNLLCILYEKAQGRDHLVSVEEVASVFVPPQSPVRIKLALQTLEERKLAILNDVNPDDYRITASGAAWVEAEYSMNFDGKNWQFRRRKAPGRLADLPSQKYNWTKLGAVAAWIIIPITLAGIAVAIWLDHN